MWFVIVLSMVVGESGVGVAKVGDAVLCPTQDETNDEEFDCEVVAASTEAGIAIVRVTP